MLRMIAMATALLCACVSPDVRSPAGADRRPVARVAVDHRPASATSLPADVDAAVAEALGDLDLGDPLRRWVFERRGADYADVVVRALPPDEPVGPGVIGLESRGDDSAYVVADVLREDRAEFVSVVAHELEHWAGGEHICRVPHELPDDAHPNERCSPVGVGPAVLNPYAGGHGYRPISHPTDLDRAELARSWTRRGGP